MAECLFVLVQREAWQNIGAILDSKAQVASFCLELSKKLDMRYQSPPLPVDLSLTNRNTSDEAESMSAKIARLKHPDALREVSALFDVKN